VGLDAVGAELIRLGENALFRLPAAGVVVRVARTMAHWDDSVKEANVSRWLAEHAYPAARLAEVPQPLEVDGHPVTFWREVPGRDGTEGDAALLGVLLRRLHGLPAPTGFRLPPVALLGRVEPRIKNSEIPAGDKGFLLGACERLRAEAARLSFVLPAGPIHGDAHVANLIVTEDGPVLIDLERFAWGQPEWDLSMTATEYRTAGWWTDAQYQAFVDAYGFDVTAWDGFDVLRRVHELKMTTWIMQNVGVSSAIAAEYERRMTTLRTGAGGNWAAF
jgi:Ser/Thr protein kinase RdoA (MazF antagonist)